MGGNPNGIRSLAKYSKLPVERIRYVPDADEATVRSIRRGVLFLMAFWSGQSVQAFAKLTEVLARMDAEGLELVVADVDGSPDLYELPEFKGKVYGAGETAWMRDGKIMATSGLWLNAACFEPNTLALMTAMGNHLKCNVPNSLRDRVRRFYLNVLQCKPMPGKTL